MKIFVKNILKKIFPQIFLIPLKEYQNKKRLEKWEKSGCPIPPPHIVKQLAIAEYQTKYQYNTLVETGTYMGDMVEAQKRRFKNVISIELGVDLFRKAQKRFRNNKNIVIMQGDSGKILPKILQNINEPAIFWLDGHYSSGVTAKGDKECPIFEELEAIFASNKFNHVLLIDDARHFNDERDYPAIDKLTKYVKSKNEKYHVEVKHDIIRYAI